MQFQGNHIVLVFVTHKIPYTGKYVGLLFFYFIFFYSDGTTVDDYHIHMVFAWY